MLAGVRRLARVASALASRRNYLGVVLRGGEGSKPITLKLSLPWKRSPLPKRFESANPMLRVLPPSASGFKDDYRVTITLAENSVVIGSVQLLPKTLTLEDNFVDSSEKNEEENISEDEEEEAVAGTGEGEAEEEAFMVETSAEEYEEEDEFYSESSGDALMDLFYQGEAAERAVEIEEEEEPKYLMCDQKCSGIRRPSSSSLLDFCYWPDNSLANVTVLQTDRWFSSLMPIYNLLHLCLFNDKKHRNKKVLLVRPHAFLHLSSYFIRLIYVYWFSSLMPIYNLLHLCLFDDKKLRNKKVLLARSHAFLHLSVTS
jgi:hypothetical protein